MAGEETVVPPVVSLNLPADYEVQVAAHLTLQQLQTFGRDVDHYLKSLDKTVDEETDDRWSPTSHCLPFVAIRFTTLEIFIYFYLYLYICIYLIKSYLF